jgi:hypothetical protein
MLLRCCDPVQLRPSVSSLLTESSTRHGLVDLVAADVDNYVISVQSLFAPRIRVAWVSDRLTALGARTACWWADGKLLGRAIPGGLCDIHDVVDYFDWLGGQVSDGETRHRGAGLTAGVAIKAHERNAD